MVHFAVPERAETVIMGTRLLIIQTPFLIAPVLPQLNLKLLLVPQGEIGIIELFYFSSQHID